MVNQGRRPAIPFRDSTFDLAIQTIVLRLAPIYGLSDEEIHIVEEDSPNTVTNLNDTLASTVWGQLWGHSKPPKCEAVTQ